MPTLLNTPRRNQRLYARVVEEIAADLAAGLYNIGDRLASERDLSLKFGVARSTIREAIISLELDGLVEVKTNSGVFVIALERRPNRSATSDIGPFELLEARRTFESEICALAARLISDEELDCLDRIVDEMTQIACSNIGQSEAADRAFHLAVAQATRNSAMVKTFELLWDERDRSRQYRALSGKARDAGVRPRPSDHRAIVNALRSRDPMIARQAMCAHLTQVIDALLAATEVDEIAKVKAEVAAKRERFAIAER